MRRKAAASPKVIDRRMNTDASFYTSIKKHTASTVFAQGGSNEALNTRRGVITNTTDVTTDPQKAVRSYVKTSGGPTPDASLYTSFAASNQVMHDDRITIAANLPTQLCNGIYVNGFKTMSNKDTTNAAFNFVTRVAANASTHTHDIAAEIDCCAEGRHDANELGPPLFVGDTFALNRSLGVTLTPIAAPGGGYLGNNRADITSCDSGCKPNHTHPADIPRALWSPRPEKGAGGIPVFDVASPDDARKVGDYNPKKYPYVEAKHGNDLNVNPRRVPIPYKPSIAPAHLRINDPLQIVPVGVGEAPPPPLNPPVPGFTYTIGVGLDSLRVTFTNTTTGTGTITYSWNFGDGSPANTTTNPFHIFPTSGTYNVVLTATNEDGSASTTPVPITVTVPSVPTTITVNSWSYADGPPGVYGTAYRSGLLDPITGSPVTFNISSLPNSGPASGYSFVSEMLIDIAGFDVGSAYISSSLPLGATISSFSGSAINIAFPTPWPLKDQGGGSFGTFVFNFNSSAIGKVPSSITLKLVPFNS